jgi:hypothetical protein
MRFQEGRYDRMHILEKGRNQNWYSEEKRTKTLDVEEDRHWREQHCYDERRKDLPARRESKNFQERIFQENEVLENNRNRPVYFEDQRRFARQNEDKDQYWYGMQNHQERRRFSRDYEEVQRQDHQLDLHRFDGQNLSAWMFKIHQCFNYYGTPDDYHRYMFASYHVEGKALVWLVEMERKGVFIVDCKERNR